MSAFVVPHDHIDGLISFAIEHRVAFQSKDVMITVTEDIATHVGAILLLQNDLSVSYRYRETPSADDAKAYSYRPLACLTPLAIVKACHCLDYQSCEHPAWEPSMAYRIVKAIEAVATAIQGAYSDNQYDAAPWVTERSADPIPACVPVYARPQLRVILGGAS